MCIVRLESKDCSHHFFLQRNSPLPVGWQTPVSCDKYRVLRQEEEKSVSHNRYADRILARGRIHEYMESDILSERGDRNFRFPPDS